MEQYKMTLQELFLDLPGVHKKQISALPLSLSISSVTADSRTVQSGSLFVALQGRTQNGHLLIQKAIQAGAVCVMGEEKIKVNSRIPYLLVKDSRLALAKCAANFYKNPSHKMKVIGITGTSGKTTTSYLVESIFSASRKKVGVIGTVNTRFGKKRIPSQLTTPGAVELQKLFSEMLSKGCEVVVMEVSSHALVQRRVSFTAFDAMVFTNLSPEHLDFHLDLEDYFSAKSILFTEGVSCAIAAGKKPVAIIHTEDPFGKRLLQKLRAGQNKKLKCVTFGLGPGSDFSGEHLIIDIAGIRGSVGRQTLQSKFMGHFNALNLLGAVATAKSLDIDSRSIAKGVKKLKQVPGRLERVINKKGIHILVDYAHKPDALEKVLRCLRELRSAQLITVLGCGGDRDRQKRPVMGQIACALSDCVFITSDNPRTENPEKIIAEILKGTSNFSNYFVETDREKAIFKALRLAKKGDMVLITGKGHEDYQIIADPSLPEGIRKIHFDDREVAAHCIKNI
jgi:UDP-N-acetylmuramoyl-L-alanyl-D-glutamate--2,6-diaminopimelate ligase